MFIQINYEDISSMIDGEAQWANIDIQLSWHCEYYVQNMGNDCEKMVVDTFLIFGGRIIYVFG